VHYEIRTQKPEPREPRRAFVLVEGEMQVTEVSPEQRRQFDRLARQFEREIYNYALRLTRNRDDAVDLAQDGLVNAYRAFARFRPGSNFKAWIYRILTNAYIDKYRKRTSAPKTVLLGDASVEYELGNTSSEAPREFQPESALLAKIPDQEIRDALDSLPEEYRSVVILCDVEDMSYEDAARTLQIPTGTVRSRLHRGRRAMRRALLEYGRDRGLLGDGEE
jgi:RNA polymerase sigma-70 factor (ECF subfamily)